MTNYTQQQEIELQILAIDKLIKIDKENERNRLIQNYLKVNIKESEKEYLRNNLKIIFGSQQGENFYVNYCHQLHQKLR